MKRLLNTQQPTKALLVGLNTDDAKVLKFLFDNAIMFGCSALWLKENNPPNNYDKEVNMVIKMFPDVTAIAWLSNPEEWIL